MGLAASQARLLTLTARLADNELRSQTINNAKMRLSTESSQASENYINALNNATLKFTNYGLDGTEKTQNLSFNALTAYSSYNTQYGLINAAGQLLVSEDEAALFIKSGENLNTYLQYHGLTYETSYFKEVGNITNEGYVAPFNYITVSEMEAMYKNYNSYENSQEVETYNKAYSKYMSAKPALDKAGSKVLEDFLLSTTGVNGGQVNSPLLTKVGNTYTIDLGNGNINNKIQNLQNAFLNPNNSYAIGAGSYLYSILDDEDRADYADAISSIKTSGNNVIADDTEDLTYTEATGDDGSKSYTLDLDDGVTITIKDGVVTDYKTKDNYTCDNAKTGVSITEFLNNIELKMKDDDGVEKERTRYNVTATDENGLPKKVKTATTYTNMSADEQNELVNGITDDIIREILSKMGEKFAASLFQDGDNQANINNVSQKGIDLSKPVTGSTQTLKEYYNDYANAKDIYLNTIFASTTDEDRANIEKVKAQLKAGQAEKFVDENGNPYSLDYKDLTDVDFLLRYMAAEGLTPSSNFETVIKEFMIDKVIEEYGTPKYAWQDSTDPDNTGNADAKAQWYTNQFNRMMQGYKVLENGLASSPEWIEYAMESGIVTMEQVDASYQWQGLDYKSCARITEETDDAAVTQAEAEYNRAMNDIEAKDSLYDLELKNIDTEHSSLQTEYESIKGVISKNVERTFNFYKNA